MLSLIEARNDRGQLLSLPIFDPDEGILVQDVEGLDPVDATLIYSSLANQDDEQEQASKRVKRNIILKLGYQPDYVEDSVKSLRDRLYAMFMPKSQVRLRFYSDDMPTVEIVGRVEKFDSPLFAKEPVATISLLCAKSNFYGLDTLVINGNTTAGTTEQSVTYDGTIETGGLFRLVANRAMTGFTIYNRLPDDSVRSQEFIFPIANGDIIEINSVNLNKYARFTRGGVTASALYGVSPYSQWTQLFQGVNKLRVGSPGAAVPWTFTYVNKYGGL